MISLFKVFMAPDVCQPVNDVLLSGYITQGPKVEQYEKELQKFFDYDKVLTLNAATSGLTIACRLLKFPQPEINFPGMNDDDIVLSTPLTCTATNWPILANNFNLKWIDTDPTTCNMDLEDLKTKIGPKTKAIMVVHWGGTPIDLNKLSQIQDQCLEKYGFRPIVIEDCAHAFGAEINGKKVGTSHGNIGVFSTQAIKHLTTGDGGIITLPTEFMYQKTKLLRWYGIDRDKRNYKGKDFRLEHDVVDWGYKFHMNDINATIGLANLPHMEKNLNICWDNGTYYQNQIEKLSTIYGSQRIQPLCNPNILKECKSAYWLFTFLIERKSEFIEFMKERNIMASQVHQRNDIHTCVKDFKDPNLRNLDWVEQKLICIPVGWWVNKEDREYIIKCTEDFLK